MKQKSEPVRPDPRGVIRLRILGNPRSKANALRGGRRGSHYQPKWVGEFEASLKARAAQSLYVAGYHKFPIFTGRVEMTYRFYFAHKPTTRDLDNSFKSVNDALQGVLYVNDRDIWRYGSAEKFHDKERPRIEIEVRALEVTS
jgi:Holliday junction resolvase RusA-like endonuclease